jgi:hypothetical protein
VVPRAQAIVAPGSRLGLVRSESDLAADADLFTGFATGILNFPKGKPPKFTKIVVGGTSLASPLVAGIIADAQQGQQTVFGFTDPVLYRLNGTSALHDMLPSISATRGLFRGVACNAQFCGGGVLVTFDDQSRAMPGYTGQVTVKGYDNMTGIGTPNGQQFIKALRGIEN